MSSLVVVERERRVARIQMSSSEDFSVSDIRVSCTMDAAQHMHTLGMQHEEGAPVGVDNSSNQSRKRRKRDFADTS